MTETDYLFVSFESPLFPACFFTTFFFHPFPTPSTLLYKKEPHDGGSNR